MSETIYEPLETENQAPATKADVERILRAIEYLAERVEETAEIKEKR